MKAREGEIVGREPELDVLMAFLDRREELPGAMLIEGEPGIGKTTLWQEGVAAAGRSGYRVLSCRPAGGEVQLSADRRADLSSRAHRHRAPRCRPRRPGALNKEVAAQLFVSVRAVEANLSRIYAKLGIRSRSELAHRL